MTAHNADPWCPRCNAKRAVERCPWQMCPIDYPETAHPEVTKGMRFKSNDPRDGRRGVYRVDAVADGKAILARNSSDWTRVSLSRLYPDEKARRSGWSRVP